MPFDRHAKLALIVACVTLLACSIGFRYAVAALNIYLHKEPVQLRGSFSTISRTLGPWSQVGEDAVLDDALLLELGTSDTISRAYALEGDPRNAVLGVHVAYYTGMIDAVPHIPDRCFVAAGLEPVTLPTVLPLPIDRSTWTVDPGPINLATQQPYQRVEYRHPFTNQLLPVRMPVGDIEFRVTQFARKDQPDIRHFAGFLFIANGRATATPEQIRVLAFKPSERFAYYCKVQITLSGVAVTQDQYLAHVARFLDQFLPELMLRLPDWQQVERQSPDTSSAPARSSPAITTS